MANIWSWPRYNLENQLSSCWLGSVADSCIKSSLALNRSSNTLKTLSIGVFNTTWDSPGEAGPNAECHTLSLTLLIICNWLIDSEQTSSFLHLFSDPILFSCWVLNFLRHSSFSSLFLTVLSFFFFFSQRTVAWAVTMCLGYLTAMA